MTEQAKAAAESIFSMYLDTVAYDKKSSEATVKALTIIIAAKFAPVIKERDYKKALGELVKTSIAITIFSALATVWAMCLGYTIMAGLMGFFTGVNVVLDVVKWLEDK